MTVQMAPALFQITTVLVRFDHVASTIVNANYSMV
jgi:hypothetical protein